jgi:hypothetical protein
VAVVTAVAVVMAVATVEAVMLVDTAVVTSAGATAVDTSGVVTSADVILPAGIMAVLMLGRVTSVEAIGLRAGMSSVVGVISVTTRSATDTNGITLPGSAVSAGAAGVADGAVGEAGLDRCSGRFYWETSFRARFGQMSTATRSGPTALSLPMTTPLMCQRMGTAVRPTFTAMPRATRTIAELRGRLRSRPT